MAPSVGAWEAFYCGFCVVGGGVVAASSLDANGASVAGEVRAPLAGSAVGWSSVAASLPGGGVPACSFCNELPELLSVVLPEVDFPSPAADIAAGAIPFLSRRASSSDSVTQVEPTQSLSKVPSFAVILSTTWPKWTTPSTIWPPV